MFSPQMLLDAVTSPPPTVLSAAIVAVAALVWLTRSKPPPLRPASRLGHTVREPHRLPTTHPLVADTFSLVAHMRDLHDYMTTLGHHFRGEPFQFRMVGLPAIYVLYTPQHVEDVLKTHFDSFPKGPFLVDNLREVLGHGIFVSDGLAWLHQRKVASHLFTMRAMRDSMALAIAKHLEPLTRVLDRAVETQEPINLYRLFNRFTMETFAEIGFGVDLDTLERTDEHPLQRALDRVQEVIVLRFNRPTWFWKLQRWLNIGAEREMKTCVATLNESVLDIVTKAFERRTQMLPSVTTNAHSSRDLVSLFMNHIDTLAASERGDIEFNATFFRDVVMNFMIAGRDTTAQVLSWLFVELSSKPEIESKIRDKIQRVMPSLASGQSKTLAIDELPQLVYLEAVIRETLRLHPSVPIIPKYVAQDVVLSDGTLLRKGNSVSVSAYVMARMSFVWGDDAAEFKPDRWIDSTTGKLVTVSQFKFPSFNAGPRLCLGMSLAIMEIKMVLVTLLSKFHLELEPGQNITYVNSVSLPIKGELLMLVRNAPLSL